MQSQEIAARLERLEKSNRRLRWAAVVLGAGVVAMTFLGAEQRQDDLVVQKIRIVDAAGKLRGAIGSDANGTFFFLNDPSGKMRTSIAAQKGSGFMNIKDDSGRTRVLLSYDAAGAEAGSVVRVQDDQGLHATLIDDQRGPALQLGQEKGRVRVIAPMIDILQEPQPADDQKPDEKAPEK